MVLRVSICAAILVVGAIFSYAHANICASNTDGRTAICGEDAGKCFYQQAWGADTFGPFPSDNAGNVCCYDPGAYECGGGAVYQDDEFVTPLVSAKKEFITSSLGRDLSACGLIAIPNITNCRLETSCSVLGYSQICPLTRACTNDLSYCPEVTSSPCSGASQSECGGACYDNRTHFCFESLIYSKETHFKCGDELYEVGPTRACCDNRRVYNPQQEGCCGSRVFELATEGCCSGTVYSDAEKDCDKGHIVDEGHLWSTKCREQYNPDTHVCLKGRPPFPTYGICRIGESYAKKTCYVAGSAQIGSPCALNDECARGACQGGECVCKDDGDCGAGQFCNNRIGQNRCLADGSLELGESCIKNKECDSGKCQGGECVCDTNSDCGAGQFCNNRLGQNRCLADGSLEVGESCAKNQECDSGKCQGGECVCDKDNDCGPNQFCNNRAGANRCLADGTRDVGRSCVKNRECRSDKCEGGECVCKDDGDCPGSQRCKKPVFGQNRCE